MAIGHTRIQCKLLYADDNENDRDGQMEQETSEKWQIRWQQAEAGFRFRFRLK
jgi:hypothetical protein